MGFIVSSTSFSILTPCSSKLRQRLSLVHYWLRNSPPPPTSPALRFHKQMTSVKSSPLQLGLPQSSLVWFFNQICEPWTGPWVQFRKSIKPRTEPLHGVQFRFRGVWTVNQTLSVNKKSFIGQKNHLEFLRLTEINLRERGLRDATMTHAMTASECNSFIYMNCWHLDMDPVTNLKNLSINNAKNILLLILL
jgi:hypothetical protein